MALLGAAPAVADRTYHSERLDLVLTDAGDEAGHPELRSGHVVNIHPNGPVNGALERYLINGAQANTEYQVVIEAYDSLACAGEPSLEIPTALLTTNRQGNAHGRARFSRAELDPFSGATIGVRWTLISDDDVTAYETECTVVSID